MDSAKPFVFRIKFAKSFILKIHLLFFELRPCWASLDLLVSSLLSRLTLLKLLFSGSISLSPLFSRSIFFFFKARTRTGQRAANPATIAELVQRARFQPPERDSGNGI
jgi:hypothetical protein